MRYATFLNYTNKPFTGFWNGKPYTFQPGAKGEHMHEAIASHFAKHLANQVLTENGKERYCSPKKPEDVPLFMEEFNKAFLLEGNGEDIDAETGLPIINQNTGGNLSNSLPSQPSSNITVKPTVSVDPYDARNNTVLGPGSSAQVIGGAIGDDEDDFEEK